MISQHNCAKVVDMKMGLDANNTPFPPRDPESFFPLTNIFLGGESPESPLWPWNATQLDTSQVHLVLKVGFVY